MAGSGSFEQQDDISTANGGMGLWWYHQKKFTNACFEIEFKTSDENQNSGIFVRFPHPQNDPWIAVKKGYEIQIYGNESHPQKTGAIYNIQPAIHPNLKIGEWNLYKIITAGDQIAVILNGTLINLFQCQPGRGDHSGYLGLQNHDSNSPVQFRNIKVHELTSYSLLNALDELKIPRSTLTHYQAEASQLTTGKKKTWYHLADHGPAFFQTFSDWYNGAERPESALKGIALSYSALPNRVALFNTETLALVSATDRGINLINTPWGSQHGKINQFNNKNTALFNTMQGPVWADPSGSFLDQRTLKGYGNFSHLAFKGYFRHGNRIILDYSVNYTRILDSLSDHHSGLLRFFEIAPHTEKLTLRLLDSSDLGHPSLKISSSQENVKIISENDSHFLNIPPSKTTTLISLLYTKKPTDHTPPPLALSPMLAGGPPISPEVFHVDAQIDHSRKAWQVDQIPLPPSLEKSPYKSKIRLSDIDFFSDGNRALLSTWDGDIWLLSGLQEFKKLTWKRYATGFFEPLGLKILNDIPYIAGRDGIYKIHDLNNDDEADKFEIFNNDVYLSNNFHAFQFGLETDKLENFYFAKASPVRPGGRGFDKILPHHGTFIKVSADGKNLSTIATGLRAPGGIAIGPNGEITTGENEGTWQPACKINYYEPNKHRPFFGVEDTRHGNPSPYVPPLCYLPMSVDNSGGGQIWVPEKAKIGIAPQQLLHLSYGKSSIYHVLRQKITNGRYQGGVVKLPVKLSSSAQRAAFHPDGSIFIVGFRGWQTNAANISGLQRIRRNEEIPNPLPFAMTVTQEGITLNFHHSLDEELATDPTSFTAQRWKYIRSSQYGSGQFSIDRPDKAAEKNATLKESKKHRQRDPVQVTSARLSEDKKSIHLTIADHKPCQQFQLEYDLETAHGQELIGTIHSTIHQIPSN